MSMAVFWHFFCFRRMYKTAGDRNRFVDCHTQYGMETVKGHSFFLCAAMSQSGMLASIIGDCRISEQSCCEHARNAHGGFTRIKRLDKNNLRRRREKERWNEK